MKQQDLPVQDPERDLRLSHSSASLLLGCEQRYWHYKVNETDKDPDYDDNQTHFAIGKAFHYILETTKHRHPKELDLKMSQLLSRCVNDEEIALDPEHKSLVNAMVISYLRKFKEEGYECLEVEFDIKDSEVIGYVDALVKNTYDNFWYILDLKTAKAVSRGLVARLPRNRQLNLYSYFVDQYAERFNLDPSLYGGCIYSVTTKSQARKKPSEEDVDFVQRLLKIVRTENFIVPKNKMNPKEIYDQHMDLYKRSRQLRQGDEPRKNYEYCFQYFQPCPYWSNCHGDCYTDMENNEA